MSNSSKLKWKKKSFTFLCYIDKLSLRERWIHMEIRRKLETWSVYTWLMLVEFPWVKSLILPSVVQTDRFSLQSPNSSLYLPVAQFPLQTDILKASTFFVNHSSFFQSRTSGSGHMHLTEYGIHSEFLLKIDCHLVSSWWFKNQFYSESPFSQWRNASLVIMNFPIFSSSQQIRDFFLILEIFISFWP